jgi:NADH:ubiquinone oxidoreductase subunit 5 (subunit L)/multisubunit Na+/H+ antiporter MnhA subunit
MLLLIFLLPLLGCLIPGLLGRYIGNYIGPYISTSLLGISTIIIYILYYKILVYGDIYVLDLCHYIRIDNIQVDWAFLIDDVSITLLVAIGTIGTLVH